MRRLQGFNLPVERLAELLRLMRKIPDGAKLVRFSYDHNEDALALVFEHESFLPHIEGSHIVRSRIE